ncbi:c-type cytochrome [Agrobacterium tumefaciens]|uniref:c-type cytochrome n=1 Tax=Agrobacterium tumefaciens TaxID=358 RepID=UPI0021CF48AA|nr:cytochrome c family protein [Agrobacterium tumefaciens]UXS05215.1 cytochrome c family protein [Agrobacterium tumefaciens]
MRFTASSVVSASIAFLLSAAVPAFSEGDVGKGERVFSRCSTCHSVDAPRTRMGPHLMGVVGRPMASVADYNNYSQAMKDAGNAGRVWSEEELAKFIASPKKAVPGTSMRFFGLWSETEIADLIAFLKAHPLPAQ